MWRHGPLRALVFITCGAWFMNGCNGGSSPVKGTPTAAAVDAAPTTEHGPAEDAALAISLPSGAVAADASASGAAGAVDAGQKPLDTEELARRLFEDDPTTTYRVACPSALAEAPRVSCFFARRFSQDAAARALAEELFAKFGVTAGVAPAHTMDGGFRGNISLVPAPPEGAERKHLSWIVASYKEFDAFFTALAARAGKAIPYRVNDVSFRFMRSIGRTTPSAYAENWRVSYNVAGSLLHSEDGVRDTLFHEIFHLNDQQHGDWSPAALSHDVYDPIVKKCGTGMACLAPYAPNDTTVRGGTYYAFQQNNGLPVREYAAELAVRYEKEHRAVLAGKPPKKPWKCITPENGVAWARIRDEFFAGADLTPSCP